MAVGSAVVLAVGVRELVGGAEGRAADVVEAVGKVRNAFDINQSAQDAALASLGNDEEIARRRALTAEGRAQLAEACAGLGLTVATGIFQADMKVSLVNDGPVTFLLDSKREF